MNGKIGTFLLMVSSFGCSVASEPAEQQRGLEGTGVAAPPEDPEPEDPGEGPSCQPNTPRVIQGWATHRNGHYAFQAPTSLYFAEIGVTAPVELVGSFDGNTDPAISKYYAETSLAQQKLGAWWFMVRVRELHAAATPSDRLAELAAMPQGLPPPGREHNHECGITESRETIYACLPAVDAVEGCNTIRGYSYEWTRFVYTSSRVFELECSGAGIVDEKDEICAKVLDSLVVSE